MIGRWRAWRFRRLLWRLARERYCQRCWCVQPKGGCGCRERGES